MTLLLAIMGSLLAVMVLITVRRDSYHAPVSAFFLGLLKAGAVAALGLLLLAPGKGEETPLPRRTVFLAEEDLLRDPGERSGLLRLLNRARKEGRETSLLLSGGPLDSSPGGAPGATRIAGLSSLAFAHPAAALLRARWDASIAPGARLIVFSTLPPPPEDLAAPAGEGWEWYGRGARRSGLLSTLRVPADAMADTALDVGISLTSPGDPVLCRLWVDGRPAGAQTVTPAGEGPLPRVLPFTIREKDPGDHTLVAEVRDFRGGILDRRGQTLSLRARPRVFYLTLPGWEPPLEKLLRSRGHTVLRKSPAALLDPAASPFRGAGAGDLLILDAVPPAFLGKETTDAAAEAVSRRGASLLLIPGSSSWDRAGAPALERLLPVKVGMEDGKKDRTLALVAVVDTSMSMFFDFKGVRKVDMAKKALLNLSMAMRDKDRLGILGVDTHPWWLTRPTQARDPGQEAEKIRTMIAFGGGINLYSGLREAFREISKVDADVRHIIALVDTADVDEYRVEGTGTVWDLIDDFRRAGVTVSLVGFGGSSDEHVPYLNSLAERSGGYLYLATDIQEIPGFFLEDLKEVSRDMVERKTMLVTFSSRDFPTLERMPPLAGQVLTTPRMGASLLAWSEREYPLFTLWRFGRGAVGVFAADSGVALAPGWTGKEQGPLWDLLLSRLMPRPEGGGELYSLRGERGTFLTFRREEVGEGPPAGTWYREGLPPLAIAFQEEAPGEWRAFLEDGGRDFLVAVEGQVLQDRPSPSGSDLPGQPSERPREKTPVPVFHSPLEILRDPLFNGALILLAAGLFVLGELFRYD